MRDKVLAALALNAEGDESIREVDMTSFSTNDWVNYTRTYPTGYFNLYLRAAGSGVVSNILSQVTSGWGTSSQTSNVLGSFSFTNSGGPEVYAWVPLQDTNGALAAINLHGTNTLTLTAGAGGGANGGGNLNFLMLVPRILLRAPLTVAVDSGTNTVLSFPSQAGGNYQVQFKNSLTDATWTPLNAMPLPGTGTTLSVTNFGPISNRFYRLLIQ